MNPFLEGLLFLAILAGVVAIVAVLSKRGTRALQAHNTDALRETARFTCPIHGPYSFLEAVVASNPCPRCYLQQARDTQSTTIPPNA